MGTRPPTPGSLPHGPTIWVALVPTLADLAPATIGGAIVAVIFLAAGI